MGAVRDLVRIFCEERHWDQFHGPKDLAIGIVTEAAELLEEFRFLSEEQQAAALLDPVKRGRIENELADVYFFLLRFAQLHQVDLEQALQRKLQMNAERYPVDKARGSNRTAEELGQ